ncbi:nitric oxide reductase activation protein NorD [Azoarcus olearius]|uniref:Nitric-oxide reductase accessory cytoplasmic protein n=1 Tax=Azoarcus sp. (strain BH72) TaxID=418699 RepID=A1KA58_AZOSB|nr:VWA domain-containing protein [Azoarcus olearius]CAL95714.1 nitric-oxide reductase accessory cytoplasmic protein [Azoarcus olearius]
MEEAVGKLWHRLVTRAAGGSHPEAAVTLKEVERRVGVVFRALGGDGGLRVAAATEDEHGARRSWLARVAGSGEKIARARLDENTLRLPAKIEVFADAGLNRDLYVWLGALAGAWVEVGKRRAGAPDTGEAPKPHNDRAARYCPSPFKGEVGRGMGLELALSLNPIPTPTLPLKGRGQDRAVIERNRAPIGGEPSAADRTPSLSQLNPELHLNQLATLHLLTRWPGLAASYRRLVTATLALRPDPARLPPAEAERERALRRALIQPGSIDRLPDVPPGTPAACPVLLWLAPPPAASADSPAPTRQHSDHAAAATANNDEERRAHRAERVDTPQQKHGLLMLFRAESLLSVAEFIKLDRSTDDDPDPDAASAAAGLDHLSLARDGERVASKVRFDLDLPSAAEDDVVLGDGIALPEWDYRKNLLREDHVRLVELAASPADPHAAPAPLPAHLRRGTRRLQQQFAALQPARRWIKAQADGSELDVDAAVRAATDRACGRHPSDQLWLSLERRERDLACLALADLSLSTDSWVSSEARVIDVIRDSLLLFGEALAATGDRFALCGFSSVKRSQVRFHRLKDFDERFDDRIRGRVMAIKPGYYTRLGAAIRHATALLEPQPVQRRVLLILSDGKPNDLDLYDGRYGIEDTRMAVAEARRRGVLPFCVTIDREGADYLPHLFGPAGYAVIRKPEELPARLPMFYAQLTR